MTTQSKPLLRKQRTSVGYGEDIDSIIDYLDKLPTDNLENSKYIRWIDYYQILTLVNGEVSAIVTWHMEERQSVGTY